MSQRSSPVGPSESEQAIGQAIQDLTATRLGRGFVPLAVLSVVGLVELGLAGMSAVGGWVLLVGSAATAGTMLAYALRTVQLTFGRPERPWMTAAMMGSLVPPIFTLYVLAWRGLRGMAVGEGISERSAGVVLAVVGWWALRSWMQVVEVQRLARVMSVGADPEAGEWT